MFDIESFEITTMEIEFVRHNLRLAYSFTNVGCQGRSLGNFEDFQHEDMLRCNQENGVTVWDVDSKHFRIEHLFTGTSRCRAGGLLQVASTKDLKDIVSSVRTKSNLNGIAGITNNDALNATADTDGAVDYAAPLRQHTEGNT